MRSNNKNTLLKVVILGDGGVGKSCLMNRFVSNQFDEHSFHTIGVEFLNKDIEIDGETYTLQIWDTAGQERFKTLRTPFYRGSDICMLTYAIDDKSSFKNIQMWRNEFLHYADIRENAQFPFIVVGNKFVAVLCNYIRNLRINSSGSIAQLAERWGRERKHTEGRGLQSRTIHTFFYFSLF
ncbi:ras-related protein Rab-9B isoform X2 [Diabrotica virgifera virgifera]|uniref:Ras-related protein Rab-9A n=1 Tax=Diabrotica virgifera virgifera TaxID=50390 RepID=A0ABM5KDC9_DIAVI|nr:ras-related protein Rab-9B isoform X2 [Diabrotica virgifera virgifera]